MKFRMTAVWSSDPEAYSSRLGDISTTFTSAAWSWNFTVFSAGVAVAVGVGLGVAVGLGDCVADGLTVQLPEAEAVGVADALPVGVLLGVGVQLTVGVPVRVGVPLRVGERVGVVDRDIDAVLEGLVVGVHVRDVVREHVAVAVAAAVAVGVGVVVRVPASSSRNFRWRARCRRRRAKVSSCWRCPIRKVAFALAPSTVVGPATTAPPLTMTKETFCQRSGGALEFRKMRKAYSPRTRHVRLSWVLSVSYVPGCKWAARHSTPPVSTPSRAQLTSRPSSSVRKCRVTGVHARNQTRVRWSADPVTTRKPSGENDSEFTASVCCPVKTRTWSAM